MLELGQMGTKKECLEMVQKVIKNGTALDRFAAMVKEQGGDESYIYHPEKFKGAPYEIKLTAKEAGYIVSMDTELCGKTAVILGAGRERKESLIDMAAGIRFFKNRRSGGEGGKTCHTLQL